MTTMYPLHYYINCYIGYTVEYVLYARREIRQVPVELASRARRFFTGGSGRGEVRENTPGNYSQHSTRKRRNAGDTNQISEA